MKKIRVSEATSQALDWLVAKCEGFDAIEYERRRIATSHRRDDAQPRKYTPSTNRAQGGPIIDEALISTGPVFVDGKLDCWEAFGHDLKYDDNGEFIEGSDHRMYGPTRLIAGLRCWVASKLGEEVEVPEELLNG